METQTFPKGTIAMCNRCHVANELPKSCKGHVDNHQTDVMNNPITVYRLDTMCMLDCGHMDSHWIVK